MSLRILFVVQRTFTELSGGAQRQAELLCRGLSARGHRVRLITTRSGRSDTSAEDWGDIEIERLLVPGRATHAARAGRVALRVARLASDFDVVHGHAVTSATLGAIVGTKAAGVPIVVRPSLGGPHGELDKLRKSSLAPVLGALLDRADAMALLDPLWSSELIDLGVRVPTTIVTNAVDRERHRPPSLKERAAARRALGLDDEAPVIAFVGQLIQRKGVDALAHAYAAARRARPDAQMIVAGEGPAFAALARAGARMLGRLDDVTTVLRAADVFALPSRNEGVPNALLEAMATGLPCLVGGGALRASPHLSEAVVEADTAAALGEQLDRMLSDSELREQLGATARAATRGHDVDVVLDEWERIYSGLAHARLPHGRVTGPRVIDAGAPTMSVVIPTAGRRPSALQEAVDSALRQQPIPLEVIVVEDAPDAARGLVHAQRLRVVTNPSGRSGPAASRNAGAAVARGAWIAFLDDDDLWEPGYLAAAMDAARGDADLVLTAVDELDGAVRRPFKAPTADLKAHDLLLRNPGALGSNLVVSRAAFWRAGGFDARLLSGEDRELVLRMLRSGAQLRSVSVPRVLKRHSADAASGSARSRREGHAHIVAQHAELRDGVDANALRARQLELAALDEERVGRRLALAARLARLGAPRASMRVLRRRRRRHR